MIACDVVSGSCIIGKDDDNSNSSGSSSNNNNNNNNNNLNNNDNQDGNSKDKNTNIDATTRTTTTITASPGTIITTNNNNNKRATREVKAGLMEPEGVNINWEEILTTGANVARRLSQQNNKVVLLPQSPKTTQLQLALRMNRNRIEIPDLRVALLQPHVSVITTTTTTHNNDPAPHQQTTAAKQQQTLAANGCSQNNPL